MKKSIVLIVDDEPANLTVLSRVLSPLYQVRAVKNGHLALQVATGPEKPDIILLDVMMPEMDGFEVMARLRQHEAARSIPVIFSTALNEEHDEERGLELGAVDYITKPIRPLVVLARVKTHLENKLAKERLHKQKEALLREVHHRVKNNLSVISGLLSIHADKVHTPDQAMAAFQDVHRRIHAMAAVHRHLYESPDHGRIDMGKLLEGLCPLLLQRVEPGQCNGVELVMHLDPGVFLGVESAVPCGLMVNELIDNACKHAFAEQKKGVLRVSLRALDQEHIELEVADNGQGMPNPVPESSSLGLVLAELLAGQAGGVLSLSSNKDGGTRCHVAFTLALDKDGPGIEE